MKTIADLTILFVDDEASVLNSLRRFLRKEPYRTLFAGGGSEALDVMREQDVDILVSDLRMPGMDGLELIYKVKERYPDSIRMILSAQRDVEQIIASINTGEVFRFMPKPITPEPFKQTIVDAAEYYLLKTERKELLKELAAKNQKLKETNSDLQRMTEQLQVSEGRLRTIMEMVNDAVIMTNEKEEMVFWNNAAGEIFGYSASEAIGKNNYQLLVPERYWEEYAKSREDAIARALEKKSSVGIVYNGVARHKNGTLIPVELSASVLHIDGEAHMISVVRDISERVAAENARKRFKAFQQNIEANIEKQLLQSKIPDVIEGAEIASVSVPSKHLDGDFTDYVVYGSRSFDLLTGDVMGKGLQAALVAAGVKSNFLKALSQYDCVDNPRPNCPRRTYHSEQLEEVFTSVHAMTVKSLIELETYVTLCFSRIDLEKRTLDYVNCGHTQTVHYRVADRKCGLLDGGSYPLGMFDQATYTVETVNFSPGDLFLFYSDGILEAESESGEQFGTGRLSELVELHYQLKPELLIEHVQKEVLQFTGSDQFDDDFTCIAVKIK